MLFASKLFILLVVLGVIFCQDDFEGSTEQETEMTEKPFTCKPPGEDYQRCNSGCWYGKCYSYCSLTDPHTCGGSTWCYTTKGKSQDGNKVPCKKDSECCGYWACAGTCFF